MRTGELLLIGAKVAELSGEDIQAEQLYRRAAQYFERKHGQGSVQVAQSLIELGSFLEKKDRPKEAEECYTRMRSILCLILREAELDKLDVT